MQSSALSSCAALLPGTHLHCAPAPCHRKSAHSAAAGAQSAESKRKRALEAVQLIQHLRSFATVDGYHQLPDLFTKDVHLQEAAVQPAASCWHPHITHTSHPAPPCVHLAVCMLSEVQQKLRAQDCSALRPDPLLLMP